MLGNVEVAPFGSLPIRRINIEANVTITGVDFAPGDYNHDDLIDAADFVVWRATLGDAGPNLPADGNDNNEVDIADHGIWTSSFGESSGGGAISAFSASAAIPEPSTFMLGLASLAFLSNWRRAERPGDGKC
jgi:hypothetical protein